MTVAAGAVMVVGLTSKNSSTTTTESREFREIIEPLERASRQRLRGTNRRKCVAAFAENPAGFRQIAVEALASGRPPVALIVYKVNDGQHLEDLPPLAENGNGAAPIAPVTNGKPRVNFARYTGCRLARGTHGSSHVYDPLGTERPPADWPHERPSRDEILAELRLQEPSAEHGAKP